MPTSPFTGLVLAELQVLRKKQSISIEAISRELDVSGPTISRWLRGQGLTLEALENLCRCLGTDMRTLIERASDPATDRFSLRQERILAGDRRLSLLFFLVLNGAQREWLETDLKIVGEPLDQLIDRLVRLGLVHKGTNGRLRPLVKRSIRWRPGGPLATAFERSVLGMLVGPGFASTGTHYVSQFVQLDQAGRDFVNSRFEALCEEILRGTTPVGKTEPSGQDWSVLFLMTRPVAAGEMLGWADAVPDATV